MDFFPERNEAAICDLMSEEDRERITAVCQTHCMHSFEEALLLLGEYPWFKLDPMEIHPELYNKISAEVKRLGGARAVNRWEQQLGRIMARRECPSGKMGKKKRKIVVYGHGDKRPGLGFPADRDFENWIRENIFTKYQGRYHYTLGIDADVIILSRNGFAIGHFEIESKEKPDRKDYEDYPRVKFVYVVRSSALYGNPVRLSDLEIRNIHYGKVITEAQFDKIRKVAGEVMEYGGANPVT
jgi:hypothetical protein